MGNEHLKGISQPRYIKKGGTILTTEYYEQDLEVKETGAT
jgi:hypothetical protein